MKNTNYIFIKLNDYEYFRIQSRINFLPHFSLIMYFYSMISDYQIPELFLFNPLKHHLGFIREFINLKIDKPDSDEHALTRELKHLGTSVMDLYTGSLTIRNICLEIEEFLKQKNILKREIYSVFIGTNIDSFRIISLKDGSQWTLKYHEDPKKFVHIFPARGSKHTLRVKSNTLKSALLYNILVGKDYITVEELNNVRALLGLSPINDVVDSVTIMKMIEILRG
ncbi:MAG TPA: hypothetical protein VMV77_15440 [Bacteroidales bacterium]|nr:hypothetical protein [Bacteroidales bacterium]